MRDPEGMSNTQKIKSLVSARNHLSPQILYFYYKLSEWALLCTAVDKLGRETLSETPKTRNQGCCRRKRNGLYVHIGLVTTTHVEVAKSVEEPRRRPTRSHNKIVPVFKAY